MARRRGARKRTADDVEDAESAPPPEDTSLQAEEIDASASAPSADGMVSSSPQETPSNSTPVGNANAKPAVNGSGVADSNSSDQVSEDSDGGVTGEDAGVDDWRTALDDDEEEDEEEADEEEILVVLELADFKNHPILDDYKSITIEGIDTAKPTLHIGEYSLHGQLEETVGTHYFYDTRNRTDDNAYRYTGQTTKKIKFTIAPPDEY